MTGHYHELTSLISLTWYGLWTIFAQTAVKLEHPCRLLFSEVTVLGFAEGHKGKAYLASNL